MRKFFFAFFLLSSLHSLAQRNVTTLGIQFKPIFPVNFLGTGPITNSANGVDFTTKLKGGFSGGLVIRHGINDLLSIEGGINYVKRNYLVTITDGSFSGESDLTIINYEIPLNLLAYARLGEKLYANGSIGPSIGMFPSNVGSADYYFSQIGYRRNIIQPAVGANLGVEYRTDKSGIIYLGISFQRPFNWFYLTKIKYQYNNKEAIVENTLTGTYLTIDLRYFFHEDPSSKKSKK